MVELIPLLYLPYAIWKDIKERRINVLDCYLLGVVGIVATADACTAGLGLLLFLAPSYLYSLYKGEGILAEGDVALGTALSAYLTCGGVFIFWFLSLLIGSFQLIFSKRPPFAVALAVAYLLILIIQFLIRSSLRSF